jgi:hypothetical protein
MSDSRVSSEELKDDFFIAVSAAALGIPSAINA